jgi:hypothetical protein
MAVLLLIFLPISSGKEKKKYGILNIYSIVLKVVQAKQHIYKQLICSLWLKGSATLASKLRPELKS